MNNKIGPKQGGVLLALAATSLLTNAPDALASELPVGALPTAHEATELVCEQVKQLPDFLAGEVESSPCDPAQNTSPEDTFVADLGEACESLRRYGKKELSIEMKQLCLPGDEHRAKERELSGPALVGAYIAIYAVVAPAIVVGSFLGGVSLFTGGLKAMTRDPYE